MGARARRSVAGGATGVIVAALLAVTLGTTTGVAVAAPAARSTSWATPCVRDDAADGHWLDAVYGTFVGRAPASDELTFWHGYLHQGGVSLQDVAQIAAHDSNFEARTVATIYTALLHRDPDSGGLAFWTGQLVQSDAVLITARMATLPEYWTMNGSTNSGFVAGLYHDLLGRAADDGGLAYWTNELAAGHRTMGQLVIAFDQTPESRARRAGLLYPRVLKRQADSGGAAYIGNVLLFGDETLGAAVLASSLEYWDAAQVAEGGSAGPVPAACPAPPPRWVPPPGTVVHNLQIMPNPPAARVVALTFDDGPDPTWTPQILNVLDQYDVPATFFIVGVEAKAHPELVTSEVAHGQHVADHSWNHPDFNTLSAQDQANQINWTADLIDSIVGAGTVKCFRPPYGNYSSTTVNLAANRGLATMLWSRDGRDWAQPGVDAIVNGNLSTTYDGGKALLLLHDGGGNRSQTVAALPKLIRALRSQGYVFIQIC